MNKYSLMFVSLLFLFAFAVAAQQNTSGDKTQPAASPKIVIPMEAAREANPVKPTPETLAVGKKWWNIDCAMCHGKLGDGQGDTAKEMKLQVPDFTKLDTLKNRTDGEIHYVIQNGHPDMPGEGTRLKPEECWDLVNYVRSLAKDKPAPEQK